MLTLFGLVVAVLKLGVALITEQVTDTLYTWNVSYGTPAFKSKS